MRQPLPRVPMDRIAVLIGAKGATAKSLRHAAGCKTLDIDSNTGDVEVEWGAPGSYDPVKAMKFPDVIKAIGRGMAPKAAIRLLDDDHFFELVDIRSFVGKRSNQQRRIRARIMPFHRIIFSVEYPAVGRPCHFIALPYDYANDLARWGS